MKNQAKNGGGPHLVGLPQQGIPSMLVAKYPSLIGVDEKTDSWTFLTISKGAEKALIGLMMKFSSC